MDLKILSTSLTKLRLWRYPDGACPGMLGEEGHGDGREEGVEGRSYHLGGGLGMSDAWRRQSPDFIGGPKHLFSKACLQHSQTAIQPCMWYLQDRTG